MLMHVLGQTIPLTKADTGLSFVDICTHRDVVPALRQQIPKTRRIRKSGPK